MKITRIQLFEYDVAYAHGPYTMSHGRVAGAQRSLVVCVTDEEGTSGWGETCPNGRRYLPSFVEAEREALRLLAPALLGVDATNLAQVNAAMDDVLLGGTAAKAALDVACWDLLGQHAGLPVSEVLGGRRQDTVPLFLAAPVAAPAESAAYAEGEYGKGVRTIQVKVGDDIDGDIARVRAVLDVVGSDCTVLADANGGWTLTDALLAARRLDGLPVRLEQPCRTIAACAEVARRTSLPWVVDESATSIAELVRAKEAGASGVNIKIGRLGGLTRARALRDTAEGLGMTFTVDDTWGGSLVTAQNAHLAASSDPQLLTGTTYFTAWTHPAITTPGPQMLPSGRGSVPTTSGLGVEIDTEVLGPAVLDVAATG